MSPLLHPDELERTLREVGERRYHHGHAFHQLLNDGRLTRNQVRAWALNRYCYQAAIPIKDASILARMEDASLRRVWRQRVIDHDGGEDREGGLERWLKLTEGLGLDRDYVASRQGVLPGVRFAVDAYIHFVRERTLLEAIASSLTELFAPALIATRVSGMLAHYDFIAPATLAYFENRLTEAPRDAGFALDYVKRNARRPDQQQAVIAALEFKCSVLWAQLDALYFSYVEPGHIPPGAWQAEEDQA